MMRSYPGTNKALFILNPYAGIPPVKFIISKELGRRKNELSYHKSLSIDESGNLIKQNFDKYDIFIAAGGDGTVHTVASKLIGTSKSLGVLPIGSGNGFAKELGFKPIIIPLLKDITKNESLKIDVIEINNTLCLNVAGIGLDSFVAHSFDKMKTRGFWTYVWATAVNFIRLKPFHVTIRIPGEREISEDLFVATIANTRQFGNNAFIAPEAVPYDGKMDLVMIRPFPKILFPVFIFRLFAKSLNRSKYVKTLKTEKEITLITDETRFHIDGEPFIIKGEVVVRIKKDALNVLKTKFLKEKKVTTIM
jgi:diacylglycerol kinase family enzyme